MQYFELSEFECPCCHKQEMKLDFLRKIDRLRGIVGFPILINSGWRCEAHNLEVGGSSTSSHLLGLAADIRCETSHHRCLIITHAGRAGFNRIGIAKTFLHLDCDTAKPKEVFWLY